MLDSKRRSAHHILEVWSPNAAMGSTAFDHCHSFVQSFVVCARRSEIETSDSLIITHPNSFLILRFESFLRNLSTRVLQENFSLHEDKDNDNSIQFYTMIT